MLSDPNICQAMRRHHLFQRMPEESMREIYSRAHTRRLDNATTLFH